MSKAIQTILIFFFSNFKIYSQEIENGRLDIKIIRNYYYKLLNHHRDSLKLPKLEIHPILNLAALDQAEYCNRKNILSHFQEEKRKYSPYDRVKFYKGNFNIVGENCLITFINIPIYKEYFGKNIIIKDYKVLAESMFLQWKNSPNHYKNMINPEFKNSGLSIFVQNDKIYGVEVFSSDEYFPPLNFTSLKEDEYGIDENFENNCIEKNKLNRNILNGFVNYTIRKTDSIYQYYENINDIKSVIKSPKDGLAIDIVLKTQFSCKEENNLNPKFYDGYLLPPKYKESLFKDNYIDNDEFLSSLGNIPPVLQKINPKDIQLNTIFIHNGKPCLYTYPISIESDYLPLIKIEPILTSDTNLGKIVYKERVNLVKKFEIPFTVNSTKIDSMTLQRFLLFLNILDPNIESIDIEVFSSIEGDRIKNEYLHKKRLKTIQDILSKKLSNSPEINSKSIENWDLFYDQLGLIDSIDTLKEKNEFGIRNLINKNKLEFQSILDEQRISKLSFKIKPVELTSNSHANQILLMDHFIEKRDKSDSRNIFNQMILDYKNKVIESDYLSFINTPDAFFDSFITANYLASIIIRTNKETRFQISQNEIIFLKDVLNLESNYTPLKFNQLALKISLYNYRLLDSLEEFKEIENSITNLKKQDSNLKHEIEKLEYNYYLTASKYYFEKRKFPLMYASYKKFKSKLQLQNLSDEEVIDIVLYMNSFYDLYTSLQLLETQIKKSDLNEDLKKLYISTGALYCFNNKYKIDFYLTQLDYLIKINSKYLCTWLNQNFQILRIDEIKSRICKKCKLE